MNQYKEFEEIRKAIEQGEQLVVGKQVSFVTAWQLYPYLRINSSRTTDYIDGIILPRHERPEHGIWADPPQFSYTDTDYQVEWDNRKEDISNLREDYQWDRIYGLLGVIGDYRTLGYECLKCHFKIYIKRFQRHPNYRACRGAMVNHIKTHFILGDI